MKAGVQRSVRCVFRRQGPEGRPFVSLDDLIEYFFSAENIEAAADLERLRIQFEERDR